MSTSDVYVWVWLPGASEPVPAGVLHREGAVMSFRYGSGYLRRPDAISLYGPTLPLNDSWHTPRHDLPLPSNLRDAAPDAWGRRVILDRVLGARGADADVDDLDESVYLLESASDRIGALDFQSSPRVYQHRGDSPTVEELQEAARTLDEDRPMSESLRAALISGTGIGGARPKATLTQGGRQWVAKFSLAADHYPVVGAEAVSVILARHAGIKVPATEVVRVAGRDVLLAERFDRGDRGTRRIMVSALTMLDVGEMESRHSTYPEIVDVLRAHGAPPGTGRDVFARVAFNMAISNTDDHLRNHAAFWDGHRLELTPAYDLSPVSRSGEESSQAISYSRDGHRRRTQFSELIEVANDYGLSRPDGRDIVDRIVDCINENWSDAAEQARLTSNDRAYLWGRQILNKATSYELTARTAGRRPTPPRPALQPEP